VVGRYIGQELTARSYHTGVIRKRILPFVIKTPKVEAPESLRNRYLKRKFLNKVI